MPSFVTTASGTLPCSVNTFPVGVKCRPSVEVAVTKRRSPALAGGGLVASPVGGVKVPAGLTTDVAMVPQPGSTMRKEPMASVTRNFFILGFGGGI